MVAIDPSRTNNIKNNCPIPRSVKDTKRYLGMVGFFAIHRQLCIYLFAFNNLRNKNVKFKFF